VSGHSAAAKNGEHSDVYDVSRYLKRGKNEVLFGLSSDGPGPAVFRARLEEYDDHRLRVQPTTDKTRGIYYGGRWISLLTTDWTWQVCDSGNPFIYPLWNDDTLSGDFTWRKVVVVPMASPKPLWKGISGK
jgi:hypothetical protein